MSHFTVLVINDESDDFEYDLAPFIEEVDIDDTFAEFMSEGTIKTYEDEWNASDEKKNYSNVEEYISEYYGYSINGDEVGYWGNPNAKWDWYSLGGRWAGQLVVKEQSDKKVKTPNFSYGWSDKDKAEVMFGKRIVTDQSQVKDIDWEYMRNGSEEDRQNARRFWELIVENDTPKNDEEKEQVKYSYYRPEYYTERYKDKETYVKCSTSFHTFAVLLNGKWIGKGDMGWFGMSNESDDVAVQWESNFIEKFIDNLSPETWLSVVDCHI